MSLTDGFHGVADGKIAMVVTYLEMLSPAALRGAALPEGLTFKPLHRDVAVYQDVFRRIGQEYLWFGRLTMTDQELHTILSDENVSLFTLERDGRPEALLELDFRTDGACELAYFGLTAELIGTGAGAYLMDQAIQLAWAQTISCFHLHTCTLDSPQALAFYIRSGFAPVRRAIEIADDPRASGVYGPDTAAWIPKL